MRRAACCFVKELCGVSQSHANPSDFIGLRYVVAAASCAPLDVHHRLPFSFARYVHESACLQAGARSRRVPRPRGRPPARGSNEASLQRQQEGSIVRCFAVFCLDAADAARMRQCTVQFECNSQ